MDAASDSVALAELGRNAVDLFRKVEKIVKEHADETWPEDSFAAESERFELWAANMGLFVAGHGSLDYRVREAERLAQTLRGFVQDLINTLEDVFQMCSSASQEDALGMDENIGDWSVAEAPGGKDGDEEDFDMKLLVDSIQDPINRLFKISTKIRNPSTRLGSSRAAECRQVDEETGVDFLQAIKEADVDYVKSVFLEYRKANARRKSRPVEAPRVSSADENDDGVWEPITTILAQEKEREKTGADSYLIERIAQANVRRRQQFAYWARHRDKLDKHTKAFQAEKTHPPTAQRHKAGRSLLGSTPGAVPSVTTATRLDITRLEISDNRSDCTVSQYAPSTRQVDDAIDAPVEFPPAPKIRTGKFFECPYCFFLCPKEVLAEKAWEAHLIHDLRPYICTYEYCRSPGQLYDSRKDWAQHENSEHRRIWRCPEHSNQVFTRLETYKRHLQEQHAGPISGASLSRVIQASESVSVTTDRACPICMVELDTSREMEGHIALHLERFARFSLPRSVINDDDGSNADSGKANRVDEEGSRDDDFEGDFEFHSDTDASETQVTGRLREVSSSSSSHGVGSTGGILQAFQAFDGGDESTGDSGRAQHGTQRSTDDKANFDNFKVSDECANPQRYDEVEQCDPDALEQTEKALGSEHLDKLAAMDELCHLLYKQGKFVESVGIDREVLELRKKVLGSKNPDTLMSMANLAITLYSLGRFEEAEKLEMEVWESRKQKLGSAHPDTLRSMSNLAVTWHSQGRIAEAIALMESCVRLCGEALGPEHSDTVSAIKGLGYWRAVWVSRRIGPKFS